MNMGESKSVKFHEIGFDGEKYIQDQSSLIKKRAGQFEGKLYLEIGGGFFEDHHASRVLPGYQTNSKQCVYKNLGDSFAVVFCLSAHDIFSNKLFDGQSFIEVVKNKLEEIFGLLKVRPYVVINFINNENHKASQQAKIDLESIGFLVSSRYEISGYESNIANTLSDNGFGKDDYLETKKEIVLVTGMAPDSGKMSFCLGQIYQDNLLGIDSGYAKFETFPISQLEPDHPINLSYEAAVADTNDFVCIDFHHKDHYGKNSTISSRDVEVFDFVDKVLNLITPKDGSLCCCFSASDLALSSLFDSILDDLICSEAALLEIVSRKNSYKLRNQIFFEDCERLESQAKKYFI